MSSIVAEHGVIGPALNGTLMTPDEFDTAEEWDECYNYELINGVLVVSPPASEGERGPNDLLGHMLRDYRDDNPQGKALDYTLTEHTIVTKTNRRRADRVIWTGLGRVPNVRRVQPSIAVEFVSEGRRSRERDYEAKREEYAEIGIDEYWIIDRFQRTMTVFRRTNAGFTKIVLDENSTYTTPLLPGFELHVGRLFAEADMLEQAQEDEPVE